MLLREYGQTTIERYIELRTLTIKDISKLGLCKIDINKLLNS